jgi:hypothetical protein
MSSVTRKGFVDEHSGQALDVRSLDDQVARGLQRAGVDRAALDAAAGADGVISGEEWGAVFDALERRDRDGSTATIDLPAGLAGELRDEIARQRVVSTARSVVQTLLQPTARSAAQPAPPATAAYIFDRATGTKTLVDPAAYEAERGKLKLQLTHLLAEIPKDRQAVLREYPLQAVKEMFGQTEEALKHAVSYYAKGDLLMAGAWAKEAGRYSSIEGKAHKLLMDEGALSYVGKRVASAGVGFLEGSSGAFLDLIDKGAGLVGAKPGLSDWNAKRYETIQEGLGALTGMDHSQLPDAAIGKLGGGLATGLAIGKGFHQAGPLGQTVLAISSAGDAVGTIATLKELHAKGASWTEILSNPAHMAKLAGAVGGFAELAGSVPRLADLCEKLGTVAEVAELAALSTEMVAIARDPSLSEADRDRKLVGVFGEFLTMAASKVKT